MYYYLVGALKRRLLLELQDSFSRHPVYNKIVPYIQNRFSFEERPQFGIVVKGSNANKVQLSADNFIGAVQSHVMLAYVGQPTYPLEWVREDLSAVRNNAEVFPTLPGVYYVEILTAPTNPSEEGYFAIDPLLTQTDEPLLQVQTGLETTAQLQQIPVMGTVRLWENRSYLLTEGRDFTVDYSTGEINFQARFPAGTLLSADYRYATASVGPIPFRWNTANFTALPGVVLAFGKRAQSGDKVAVVVYTDRVDTANAYGGKFEATFDFDVISRDTTQMEEIADLCIMYLWGEKKAALEFEGIEVVDISMGGESEEPADEVGDLYFYQASMSIQLRADWEVHVPLPLTISKVTPTTKEGESVMDPTRRTGAPTTIQMTGSSLFFATRPALVGRNDNFERIG
jgi:hypothetical protein